MGYWKPGMDISKLWDEAVWDVFGLRLGDGWMDGWEGGWVGGPWMGGWMDWSGGECGQANEKAGLGLLG